MKPTDQSKPESLDFYGRGSASRVILVSSGREPSILYNYGGQRFFSVYRRTVYAFSRIFVMNVFNVGHPAEA